MLTRAQICRKYGLAPPTFAEVRGLLESEEVAVHGSVKYDLTENDNIVLACAGNHRGSFKADGQAVVHLLPFHRFLCLRFLTTPLDETMDEIRCRNLVTHRFKAEYLKKIHNRFIARLPKALRTIAKKKAPPTRELTGKYRLMLRVLGIETAYDNPIWLEAMFEFVSDDRIKHLVETVFTTRGSKIEHQEAVAELTGYRWRDYGIDAYKSLFYDLYSLDDSDWAYYTGMLPPTERDDRRQAAVMSTNELRVLEGVRPNLEAAAELIQLNLQRLAQSTYAIGLGGDTKQLHQLINMFKAAGISRGEELDARDKVRGPFFETVRLIPRPREVKTLDDLKTSKVAQVGHGTS